MTIPTVIEVLRDLEQIVNRLKAAESKPETVFHGWIVRESGGDGYRDVFYAKWREDGKEQQTGMERGWRDPVPAIEFWDNKVGQPVKLMETPIGAFRVYTESPATPGATAATPENILAEAARLQAAFWKALDSLEIALGFEIDDQTELSLHTVRTLRKAER